MRTSSRRRAIASATFHRTARASFRRTAHAARSGLGRVALFGLLLVPAPAPAERAIAPLAADAACVRTEQTALALLDSLRDRSDALDARALALDAREREGREAEAKLAALERLRAEVDARLAALAEVGDTRARQLAEIYGRMPPERAAAVIADLDPTLATRVLSQMRPSRAAALLAAMPAKHAAALSLRLVPSALPASVYTTSAP